MIARIVRLNSVALASALLLAALLSVPVGASSAVRSEEDRVGAEAKAGDAAPMGLKVGDAAPDLELVDVKSGASVTTASLWKEKPVVVVFYRGGWCPYCTKSLSAWQGRAKDLREAGAELVAVAMEKPSLATKMGEKHKLDLRLLADSTGKACRAFRTLFDVDERTRKKYEGYGIDLAKSNENGLWQLPVPATYVIDTKGVVRFAHFDADYTKRAGPDEVIAAVKGLGSAAKP